MNNSFDVEQHSGCCADVNKRCLHVCTTDVNECAVFPDHQAKLRLNSKYLCLFACHTGLLCCRTRVVLKRRDMMALREPRLALFVNTA